MARGWREEDSFRAAFAEAPRQGGIEAPRRCDLAELASPLIEALAFYWKQRCGQRAFPARADIDPLHVSGLLPDILLLDVLLPPESYRVRLFGTRLAGANSRDLTGRALEDCGLGAGYEGLRALLDEVCDDGRPAFCTSGFYWRRQHYRRFKLGIFPLAAAEPERVAILLGGVEMAAPSAGPQGRGW